MNERIQELFEQAGGYAQLTPRGDYFTNFEDFDPEKFAELIVRECVGIVEKQKAKMSYGPTFVIKDIKQHFGVAE